MENPFGQTYQIVSGMNFMNLDAENILIKFEANGMEQFCTISYSEGNNLKSIKCVSHIANINGFIKLFITDNNTEKEFSLTEENGFEKITLENDELRYSLALISN
jgi:hypothetical protein